MPYHGHRMHHAPCLRPVTRRRLVWLVALLLLWQQVAMAAYACTLAPVPATAALVSSHGDMAAMGDACPPVPPGSTDHPLCQAHCHPDHAAQPDARAGSVPPSLLAALPPIWPMPALAASTSGNTPERLQRLRAPPPPASLLYCSLLI